MGVTRKRDAHMALKFKLELDVVIAGDPEIRAIEMARPLCARPGGENSRSTRIAPVGPSGGIRRRHRARTVRPTVHYPLLGAAVWGSNGICCTSLLAHALNRPCQIIQHASGKRKPGLPTVKMEPARSPEVRAMDIE